ncbi:hypothetical protein CAC42_2155 [Sphaceloma murrayae]|uniref:Rhodopsin domain-containing protein n=1 Tax=Sphaceloma murrayae TaxID=2082308 RepID=A0A2K1QIF2_9PEZI|nr:hypothetical protein CAC42_2155 [Sphaceloma murrayae]
MTIWSSAPPEPRTRNSNNPTLLFSWWCTIFSVVIILLRICGRKIRVNAFFAEDKVILLSIIPLLIRMGLIHVVLLFGTNNVDTAGLTPLQIQKREHGSRLVLAARIFYAMFIWMSKYTVSEFLKRTFYNTWRQSYEWVLRGIRIFLFCTFFAVVIATLAECQPVTHYWQVVPDPGPQCRQGFAQLITMGVADIITDILLVAFPIPIILRAQLSKTRKFFLVMLFSASLILIGVTGSRVPKVIEKRGRQQYRTVWASIEILVSTFVSNAVVVGSFVRGTGVKKNKYRAQSVSDSIERAPTRRTLPQAMVCDSDEDLFRSIGCRIPRELAEEPEEYTVPAKPVFDLEKADTDDFKHGFHSERRDSRWDRAHARPQSRDSPSPHTTSRSGPRPPYSPTRHGHGNRDLVAFLRQSAQEGRRTPPPPTSNPRSPTDMQIADVGGLLGGSRQGTPEPGTNSSSGTTIHDFAQNPITHASRALLSDLGGLFGGSHSRSSSRREGSRRADSRPRSDRHLHFESNATTPVNHSNTGESQPGSMELKDVGGLLK